jgi:hypothetical protein
LKTSNRKRCTACTWLTFCVNSSADVGFANVVGIVRVFNSIPVFNCVLQQSRSERRPSGLMACAKTTAGFAVEVFVEQN